MFYEELRKFSEVETNLSFVDKKTELYPPRRIKNSQ